MMSDGWWLIHWIGFAIWTGGAVLLGYLMGKLEAKP